MLLQPGLCPYVFCQKTENTKLDLNLAGSTKCALEELEKALRMSAVI